MKSYNRELGARRLVVVAGLAAILASQVVSGMPLDHPSQDIIARLNNGYIQQRSSQSPRRRQVISTDSEAVSQVNDVVVTVHATAARATRARKTVIAAAATSTASPVTATPSASTSSAASSTAASSSSISLPAVTPVAGASVLTSTTGTATSGASTSTSTSSSAASKSFFNVHNKLFPAAVAAIIGIVVGVMLILITIGKCYAHAHMTPEEKAGEYGESYKNGGLAIRGAKSLRRAFTKNKKLGSFARRNQEGTVLIDVGDEVYAVTAAVAQEYEKERSALGGSSGGSRLTVSSNSASPLRKALKNAEMSVAASQTGEVRPTSQQLVQSWRNQNAASGPNQTEDALSRSISQRLTDGLRAFRGKPIDGMSRPLSYTTGPQAYSFDSEKQDMGQMRLAEVPPSAYLPVITRGAKEWDIRPRQEMNQSVQQHIHPLQSKSSTSSLSSSNLSHERHTLTDAPVPRLQSQAPSPSRNHQIRPKSILIKREDQSKSASQRDAGYRHRKPVPRVEDEASGLQRTKTSSHRGSKQINSTSPASPKVLQQRTVAPLDSAAVYLKPAQPNASQTEFNMPQTRDLVRPLPPPPTRN